MGGDARCWPLSLVALLLQPVLASALKISPGCRPCHSLVLAQNGEASSGSPCGCGSKVTPRDKLLKLTDGQLTSMIDDAQLDVNKLEARKAAEDTAHGTEIAKLTERLEQTQGRKNESFGEYLADSNKLAGDQASMHADIDRKMNEVAMAHSNMTRMRGEMEGMRASAEALVGRVGGCDIKKCYGSPKIALLFKQMQGAVALNMQNVSLQFGHLRLSKTKSYTPNLDLVFQLEELEQRRVDLEDEINRGMFEYTHTQSHLLDMIDRARSSLDQQMLTTHDSAMYSIKAAFNLKKQFRAADLTYQNALSQYARMSADKQEAEVRVRKFQEALRACGC